MHSLPNRTASPNQVVENTQAKDKLTSEIRQQPPQGNQIVFIDAGVEDWQTLVRGVAPGSEIFLLDGMQDGVAQITEVLKTQQNVAAVHIVSHGSPGSLQFGNTQLNWENLHTYTDRLQQWRSALTDDADILLYGCNVAAGENGVAFVQQLSELTGADIAASTNLTGNAAKGGDWNLEVATGQINAPVVFDGGAIASYQGVLATFDVNANDATGLINAINNANNETTNPGADTINLLGGIYTLTSAQHTDSNWGNTGLPVITTAITINGNNSTINGNNSDYRIFKIDAGGNLTLNDLTVTNATVTTGNYGGDAGALLNNGGTVAIRNSTFTGNKARDDGGAILNFQGMMTIENSTISNNTASGAPDPNGGGIENDGGNSSGTTFLTLINSTVSGNQTIGSSGFTGDGGGIRNRKSADLTVINSTIAFNSSSALGGGIFNESGSSATAKNTIVIGNTATSGPDVSGTFGSNNANLIGNTTGSSGFGSGDIVGVTAADVLNTTLANNGGATQTHALIAGSLAIDKANNSAAPTIDQRGGERVGGVNSGTNADIGAYEATSSYVVTNTNDNNSIGSLRSAINFANINVNPVTANPQDTIRFSIGSGVQTITPTSALPTITQSVIIDGTTQPGFTNTPIIELNGTDAGTGVSGLTITAGNSTVRGLVINRFTQSGIFLQTNGNNIIEGNYIGTDVNGTVDRGNSIDGIRIDNSPNNTIGGTTAASRNIISGNDNSGIYVIGNSATGNQILGNYIGTNAAGTASLGNSFFGGVIVSAPNNIIGGTTAGAGNLISGNNAVGARGITIGSSSATGNQILGNLIGTDVTGTSILGNNSDGVFTIASNTIIGGTAAGARNIISGNNNGVVIALGAANNQVQGNYIGTDITGNVDLGNTFNGVSISSPNNTIGGTAAGARNIISGNNSYGISIGGNAATGNQVLGNYIGTKADGTSSLGNGSHGIGIFSSAANNAIGSTATGAGNTIAFNSADGVSVQTSAGTGNAILGNSIFSNTALGIDLGNDGVQANDTGDADTGTNNLQNFPILTGATSNGSSTSVAGTFNSTASTTFTLQFFSNTTLDPTGNGEGQTFLGSTTATTDASGNASFTANFSTVVPQGQFITATATDASNNTSEFSKGVTVTAPIAPGAVLINEVVTEPKQDWSTNNFNGTPGAGTVSEGVDEWVELYITKDGLNLTGATIELLDGTPVTGTITAGGAFQKENYFSSGGGSFTNTKAGDYLVLGNVSSSGQMSNSITIVLKDAGGAVIDQAQFSGGSTGIGDEAAARVPNGTDTDNDTNDFRKQAATLGTSNNIPEIQVLEIATDIPDNTGNVNFGTTPLGTAITKTFTVKNIGFSDLTLNLPVSITGTGFSLASPFGSTTITPGNSTTFEVKLDASNAGSYSGTLSFGNNDADENPFNFNISGIVQPPEVSITAGTNPNEEAATNGTFNIKLSSPAPVGGLTIDYTFFGLGTADSPADYTIAGGDNISSISGSQFVIAGGKDTATINVVPVDDSIVDPGETVNINLNNGTNYVVSGTNNKASLTIADNDSSVGFSQGNYQVNEDGTVVGAAITINRTGNTSFASSVQVEFKGDVTATGGIDYSNTTQTITFAAGETSKTVVVPITEDKLVEGNENFYIKLINPSTNSAIESLNKQFANVEILDNDSSIEFSQVDYQVNEDGTVVGASITLDRTGVTTDTASVDIQLTDGTATGSTDFDNTTQTISFAANETSKTVIIPIIEDSIAEGNENFTLTLTNPGSNTSIGTQNTTTLEIVDNDKAGFIISSISGDTSEDENTATFTVKLTSQPTDDVTIGVSSDNPNEGISDKSSLIFTAANWDVAKTVTVTGIDDPIDDGDVIYNILLAADTFTTDTKYNNLDPGIVGVTNLDNDKAGITINPTSLTTSESGKTATFTVKLDSQPTQDVTIGLTSSNTNEGTIDKSSLTFTAANWNTEQTVTVKGVDDNIVDGAVAYQILTSAATSADANYNNLDAVDVSVTNTDNDIAGFTITPTTLTTSENGTASTFTVQLNTQPTADVTLNLSSSNTGEGTIDKSSLTFTAANWNTAQTVTITGKDDSLVDGDVPYQILTAAATSTDGNYNNLNPVDINVTNTDNDKAGFIVEPTSLTTSESGTTATFTVKLSSQPTADVTIGLSSSNTNEGTIDQSSLTFTAANWNTAQTVTITGKDDSVVDGNIAYQIITAAATSTDTNYNNLNPADISVTNTDNDKANSAPTVSNINKSADEDTSITFTAADFTSQFSDVDGNSITKIKVVSLPENGTLQLGNSNVTGNQEILLADLGNLRFIPNADWNGNTSFNWNGFDGTTYANSGATVNLIINPVNDSTPTPTEPDDCWCDRVIHPNLNSLTPIAPNPVNNTQSGTDSDDTFIGSNVNDSQYGNGGNDLLWGETGHDNLLGGTGNDTAFGGSESASHTLRERDFILGNEGDDLLNGNQGDDVLNGNQGNDTVRGGQGNDLVHGGQDNDLIWGDKGDDTLAGDKGNDTLFGGNGELEGDPQGRDLLFGGTGDDILCGNQGNDTLCGDDGNDTLWGGQNEDMVFGDAGDDLLFGDKGNDSLCGGEGNDTIFGGNGNSISVGANGEQDCICGHAGNDLLLGNEGQDEICGDEGNDTLYGGKDNDTLTGGADNDRLVGDLGNDILTGGSGSDRFVLSPGKGSDTILDFEDGLDLLELGGNLTFAQLNMTSSNGATLINIAQTGELLATLNGVNSNLITQQDFIFMS